MANTNKKIKAIYRNDTKHYTIHSYYERYNARQITDFAVWFGDDKFKDLGNTRGYEDALALVKLDAGTFGEVLRFEIDS